MSAYHCKNNPVCDTIVWKLRRKMRNLKTDTGRIKKQIERLQRAGDIKKAVEVCKKAAAENENDAELHIKLGDLYMEWHLDIHQMRQYADEAVTEYQRALESRIDSAEIYFKIGMAFYYKRMLDKALSYFKLALEYNNKYAEAVYMTAEVYMRKGDLPEAEDAAQQAVKLSPFTASRAYFLLFNISFHSRRSKWLQKILALPAALLTMLFDKYAKKEFARQLSYVRYLPMMFRTSIMIFFKGFTKEVLDIYRQTIDKAPGFTELYVNLGRIYHELKQYEDAVCEYKMAVWLDSLNTRAYYYMCSLYEDMRDYESAAGVCRKLIEIQPYNADFHCRLAQYLYMQGNIEEAVSHYQTAVTLNPGKEWTSVAAQTLGFIFQENIKNLDAAASAYQNAYHLNPEDIDIYLNLGSVFFEKESYDNALAVYKKALEYAPHNARIHCNLGYLYWGKGETEEAVKAYEKAIKYDNTYDIAYNNLGVIYLDDLGKIKKAMELFEAAKKYNPNYALAHYNLARATALTGDKIKAAKIFQTALDINTYTKELDSADIEERIQDLFT